MSEDANSEKLAATEPAKEQAHEVTYLSGSRPTAECSCGKRFESTHLTYLNRGVKLHLNKAATKAKSQ